MLETGFIKINEEKNDKSFDSGLVAKESKRKRDRKADEKLCLTAQWFVDAVAKHAADNKLWATKAKKFFKYSWQHCQKKRKNTIMLDYAKMVTKRTWRNFIISNSSDLDESVQHWSKDDIVRNCMLLMTDKDVA